MKKTISIVIILIFFILITFSIILSTIGIETNRFNNIIIKKIKQTNNNINLKLNTIKFKLDIREVSLFVETTEPQINYREAYVPAKNIKVYIDFLSIIKSEPKIKKVNLFLDQIDVTELKKISVSFKPSNFTSFINNKVKKGKFNTEIEIYLNSNNLFENFIARGSVSNLETEIKVILS